jgi:hypothetical protein
VLELGNIQTQTGLRSWEQGLRDATCLGEKNIFHLMVWHEEGRETGCWNWDRGERKGIKK